MGDSGHSHCGICHSATFTVNAADLEIGEPDGIVPVVDRFDALRDFRQPAHRPPPDESAARAGALNVRVALGGALLDRGVERVHDPSLWRKAAEQPALNHLIPVRSRPERVFVLDTHCEERRLMVGLYSIPPRFRAALRLSCT